MNAPSHYDVDAFERQMRKDMDAVRPVDEFHRLQLLGNEVGLQFALYLLRMGNDGVEPEMQVRAASAVVASLLQNLAAGFEEEDEMLLLALQLVAGHAIDGGEQVGSTPVPEIVGGRA